MLVRVNNLPLAGTAAKTGRAQAAPAARGENSSASAGGADRIDVSSLSRALRSQAAARSPRLDRLSTQYRAGGYAVDPLRVSQAMVSGALHP